MTSELDREGVHRIGNTENADRVADIVFVHGLRGAAHSSWRFGTIGKPDHFFWPEELAKDLPSCGVWTVGFPAGLTGLGEPGMIIEKRAGNIAHSLALDGLGNRPLIFIAHSMGGLIVKSLLVSSQTMADRDRKQIASMVRGIAFCGTPHRGSAFANAAGILGAFFGGSQNHVDEMRANAEPLDFLHDEFIEWHRRNPVPVESYAENIGLFRKRWFRRPLPLGVVVPRASANPNITGYPVHDADDDHLTLVKPADRKHVVFAGALRFVRDVLAEKTYPLAKTSPTPEVSGEEIRRITEHYTRQLAQTEQDRDTAQAQLTATQGELGQLRDALARVKVDADAGDRSAQQAIAEARRSGDIDKLQTVLIREADQIDDQVKGLAGNYVKLAHEIAAVSIVRGDLAEARKRLGSILRLTPDDVWAHIRLGDVEGVFGSVDAQRAAYCAALKVADEHAASDSTSVDSQHDVAAALDRWGNALIESGDIPAALSHYRRALAIADGLAQRDPANTAWQRDLSVSHEKIGNVLVAQGDLPAALTAYRKALEIAEQLALHDPANTAWQRDLSVSHEKIGNVLVAQGELPAALATYRKSLEIRERLVQRDSANTEWQRDLSISHEKIGSVLVAQGDRPTALTGYRKSMETRERLAQCDPANTEWQRDLAISHNSIGDVLVAHGDLPAALTAYRKFLKIIERLAQLDPANTQWQRDLSISYDKVGNVLRAQGDAPAALNEYRQSLNIAEWLAQRDPANTLWQRDLLISHGNIGDVLVAQGDRPAALTAYRKAQDIAERLAKRDPANTEWQRDLSVSHYKVGDVLVAQGDRPAALDDLRRALEIAERLAALDPSNAIWKSDLEFCRARVAQHS
jgi:tetratricopeptide (TPR) repeat protein